MDLHYFRVSDKCKLPSIYYGRHSDYCQHTHAYSKNKVSSFCYCLSFHKRPENLHFTIWRRHNNSKYTFTLPVSNHDNTDCRWESGSVLALYRMYLVHEPHRTSTVAKLFVAAWLKWHKSAQVLEQLSLLHPTRRVGPTYRNGLTVLGSSSTMATWGCSLFAPKSCNKSKTAIILHNNSTLSIK